MSYQDPWLDPMETGEMDPAAMDQAMVDYLVANGVGAGMVPDYQMSGKPLTVANQTSALNAYRSSMFDTAFQGLGGPQAFAPGAFEPTVSTSIKQTPELQQVYGYLRSPTSMEGIIAQEMMIGGTPATAQRALQQLLTATPEEIAATFAGYDQFFGRAPTVTAADAERIKTNLLMELPQRPVDYGMPAPERTIENVNWDADENSVTAQARLIGELQAEIPRVGPSAPQWSVDPQTGQPIQTSAGGELQWDIDETGAPVLVETTVTPSEAAQTFTDLGLPTPADEYTAESFMSPETNALFEALPQYDQTVQAAMAAMMDPSLAPSNRETMTPYDPNYAPGGGSEAAQQEAPRTGWNTGLAEILGDQGFTWRDPVETTATLGGNQLADVMFQNPSGDTGGWKNSIMRQGLWDILTGNEGNDQPVAPGSPGALPVQPDEYAAGSPATYDAFLTQQGFPTTPAPGPVQPRPVSASDQLQNQAQAETRAPDWLSHAPGSILTGAGGAQAPNPVTIMGQPVEQYLPRIETGERSAREQREADERNAQVLGGSTDRTGKRVRPTRTGEQARAFRAAMDQWHGALDQRNQARQATWGSAEFGQGVAQEIQMRRAGVRPLDQALMARRLVLMNAGMPQGV